MKKNLKKIIVGLSLAAVAFGTVNMPLTVNAEEIDNQEQIELTEENVEDITEADEAENATEETMALPEETTETVSDTTDVCEVNLENEGSSTPVTKEDVAAMTTDLTGIVNGNLTVESCVYGNEWAVMTAARAGVLSNEMVENYYNSLVSELAKNPNLDNKATTFSRVIIALSAIGKNPEDVNGINLLKPLSDMDFVKAAGVNAVMYVLIALDTKDYTIPQADAGKTQTTRDGLVAEILSHEVAGGGWDWYDTAADPDLTANGIQALTPYYNTNDAAKAAVDRALAVLSDMQNEDGSYSSWGTASACSAAQVLTAVTGMGINPMSDKRFIKGTGFTIFDGISMFYVKGEGVLGYGDVVSLEFDTMQSAYALVSYDRLINGKNALYNMKEEPKVEAPAQVENKTEDKTDKSPKTGDNTQIGFVLLLLMISGLGIIIENKKHRA